MDIDGNAPDLPAPRSSAGAMSSAAPAFSGPEGVRSPRTLAPISVAMDGQGFAVETETDPEEILFVVEEVAGAATEEDCLSPFAIR